jgi:hypothetical protein
MLEMKCEFFLSLSSLLSKVIKTGPDVEPVKAPVQGSKVQPGSNRGSTGIN